MSANLLWKHLESSNWEEATTTLSCDNENMANFLYRNKLPLHYAIKKQAPEELILSLIENYNDAVTRQGGKYDMTPLHYAVVYASSYNVMKALVKGYPDALDMKDKNGKTPRDCVATSARLSSPAKRAVMASTSDYEAKIISLTAKAKDITAKLKGQMKEVEEKVNNSSKTLESEKDMGIKVMEEKLNTARHGLQTILEDLERVRCVVRNAVEELKIDTEEETVLEEEEEEDQGESKWLSYFRQ